MAGEVPAGAAWVDLLADTSKFAASAQAGISKSTGSLGGMLKKWGGLLGVGVGAAYAISFGRQAIAAANEAAEATARLMSLAAKDASVNVDELTSAFTEMEYALAVDDDAMKGLASTLLSMGFQGTTDELIQQVQAIEDIASATGKGTGLVVRFMAALNNKNLTQAIALAKRFGLATGDEVTALKDLVASQQTEKAMQILLDKATTKYLGTREKEKTSLDEMRVAWDELKETIGRAITTVLNPLWRLLGDVAKMLANMSDATKELLAVLAGGAGLIVAFIALRKVALLLVSTKFVRWIIELVYWFIRATAATNFWTASMALLNTALTTLAAHPVIVALTLIAAGAAAIFYQSRQAAESYRDLVDAFKQTPPNPKFIEKFTGLLDVLRGTGENAELLFGGLSDKFKDAFEESQGFIREAMEEASGSVDYFAEHSEQSLKTLEDFAELTGTEFEAAGQVIKQFATGAVPSLESVKKAFDEVQAGMDDWRASIVEAFGGAQGALEEWSAENGDTIDDAIGSLQKYIHQLDQWQKAFSSILKKAGPDSRQFLADMAQGGLDNLALLQQLAGAAPKTRDKFIEMYNKANEGTETLADVITNKLLPKFVLIIRHLRDISNAIRGLDPIDFDTTNAERKLAHLRFSLDQLILYGGGDFAVDYNGPVTFTPPTPPPSAKGGITMGPQVRLVGEAGPEAIIPLRQAGRREPMTLRIVDWRNGIGELDGELMWEDQVRGA